MSVPLGAVLFHKGLSLVYVRMAPERYEQRAIRLLAREGERWVLAEQIESGGIGVAAGEAVVSRAAQVLLSEQILGREE